MLLCHKSALMQAIQDCVSNGFTQYTSGVITGEKLPDFLKKMSIKYAVNQHRQTEYRRRKKGVGNARLYVYPANEFMAPQSFVFYLLVSNGIHAAHEGEELQDIHEKRQRITVGQFELVRQTRVGNSTPCWTWRFTQESRETWETLVVKLARNKNTPKLKQAIYSLDKMPGFSGIRKDRKHLYTRMKAAWRKEHKTSDVMPPIPLNRWLRRVERKKVVQIQHFVNTMYDNNRSAAEQMRVYLANRNPKYKPKHL